MTLGSLIEQKRKELGLTQEQLAAAVGTTKSTVSRWESGDIRKMKASMIVKMSKTLNVDPMFFLQQDEVLTPEEYDVISAYRRVSADTRYAVQKLLDIRR